MKKLLIAGAGGTVLMIGLAVTLLPGPGLPMEGAGLAILATEFFGARTRHA